MKRAFVVAVLVAITAASAQASAGLQVWFVREGRLVQVDRPGAGVQRALDELLRGPTARERRDGVRTAVPAGVPVLAVEIRRRVVTLDLGARVAAAAPETILRNRVRQLVRTVDGVPGVAGVRIRVQGGVPLGLFPGLDVRPTLTSASLPDEPGRSPGALERRLDALGLLPPAAGSSAGERLAVAALAFEKWARLPRDAELPAADAALVFRAVRPEPVRRAGPGRRVEVLLDRQLALLIEHDRVLRVVHISTGAPGTSTPTGSYRVYRKERLSWSVPFEVWMPWASYFTGGIAFHEYWSVPAYAASHGCVRVNRLDAPWLFAFAGVGTPVQVVGTS